MIGYITRSETVKHDTHIVFVKSNVLIFQWEKYGINTRHSRHVARVQQLKKNKTSASRANVQQWLEYIDLFSVAAAKHRTKIKEAERTEPYIHRMIQKN